MKKASPCEFAMIAMVSTALLAIAPAALAEPLESLADLAMHPLDASTFALRYEGGGGGLLISRDGGKTFSITPSRSFASYEINTRIPMIIDSDGRLLFSTLDGLFGDDKAGCVGLTPEMKAWVTDFAPHPADPHTLFLVTTGTNKDVHTGIWRRDSNGTLTALGPSEPLQQQGTSYQGFLVSGLRVVPSEAADGKLRLLEVGSRYVVQGSQTVSTPVFRSSDDFGAHWDERTLPAQNGATEIPRLLAVDGSSPLKIVIGIEVAGQDSDPTDPIFFSVDGGQNFAPYLSEVSRLGAAVLLPDGRFLMGERGQTGGLWLAASIGAPLRKIYDAPIRCVGYDPRAKRLYVCQRYEFGVFDLETASFCSQFQMNEVGSLSCPTFTATQLDDIQSQLCDGWCGPGHYAFSPLCVRYDSAVQICGERAHLLDQGDPDPSKRWVEPPGLGASPRCKDALPLRDAGLSTFDAGVTGNGPSVADAGAAPHDAARESDTATPQETAATTHHADSDTEVDASGAVRVRRARGGGCQLAPRNASRTAPLWLSAFAVAFFLRRRLRVRSDTEG